MDPDVVVAVDTLSARGVLDPRAAVRPRRAASGSLVSVGDALRVLLWAGVFLITTGAGLLVAHNLERIGPLVIAIVLGAVAFGCLIWAWRPGAAEGFAFESVLLLGALLAAADLAFVEVKFTPLGPHWPWHLLIVSAGFAALAFRFDSRAVFSLALTSFAAWRGVSVRDVATPWGDVVSSDRLLIEALICGVLFLAIGKLFESLRYKAAFEPSASWLGWILIVGGLGIRLSLEDGRLVAAAALIGCGALLAWFARDERRLGRYALGLGAAAAGLGGACFAGLDRLHGDDTAYLAAVVVLAVAVLVLVLREQRALRTSA